MLKDSDDETDWFIFRSSFRRSAQKDGCKVFELKWGRLSHWHYYEGVKGISVHDVCFSGISAEVRE